jgi:hydrogenase maturation protease
MRSGAENRFGAYGAPMRVAQPRVERETSVLILGLGNLLLRDEGVGVHVVRALSERYALPDGIEILDGGTSGMELLDALSGREHVIVCDAIRSDARPGTVQRIDGDALAGFFATRTSPHQLGLSEVLASLELLGERPKRLTIIGVVPKDLSIGTELSEAGKRGVEQSIELILEDLAALDVRPTREVSTPTEMI